LILLLARQIAFPQQAAHPAQRKNPMEKLSLVGDTDPNCMWSKTNDGEVVWRKHCAVRRDATNLWWFWHDNYKSDARCPDQGLPIFAPANPQDVINILVAYDHKGKKPEFDWAGC
jgi:hypothetical protein